MRGKLTLSRQVVILFLMVAFATFAFSTLYPALNWPDELYKVEQIPYSDNIYLSLLNELSPENCVLDATHVPSAGYGSNKLTLILNSGYGCYLQLKLINAAIIVALIVICAAILRDKEDVVLLFQSLIWPSSIFFLTSINQQVIFHILSMTIVIAAMHGNRPWLLALATLPLILVDRSFITLAVFLSTVSLLKMNTGYSSGVFAGLILLTYIASPIIEIISLEVLLDREIGELTESLSGLKDSSLFSVALFFASFVYLGGTSSIFGIGFDYVFVGVFLLIHICRNILDIEIRIYILSFMFSYFFIIGIVPTIQSFRYYVFILPIMVRFLLKKNRQRQLYVLYSSIFLGVYLFQARLIQYAA